MALKRTKAPSSRADEAAAVVAPARSRWWFGETANRPFQKLPALFLVLGSPIGLLFAVVTPPFQVPDEPAHFYRSFAISEGSCISPAQQTIPFAVQELAAAFPNRVEDRHAVRLQEYRRLMKNNWRQGGDAKVSNANASIYSCVPYVASSIGIALMKIFSEPAIMLLYAARFANLCLYLLVVYAAIRIIPIGRLILFCVALMPMSLYLAASVSADGLTISGAFLLTAFILYLAFDPAIETLSKKTFFVLAALFLFATLCKFNPWFVLLVLIIPSAKFGGQKRKMASAAILLGIIVLVSALWQLADRANVVVFEAGRANLGIHVQDNLRFVLHHPMVFLVAVGRTLRQFRVDFATEFVGYFGWLSIPFPLWLVITYIALLIAAGLVSGSTTRFSLRSRLICASVVVGSTISIFALLWGFEMTPTFFAIEVAGVHPAFAPGVQGRYFIPLAPLLLLLLSSDKVRWNSRLIVAGSIAIILLSNGVALALERRVYYYGNKVEPSRAGLYREGLWVTDVAGRHRFDPASPEQYGAARFGGLPGDVPIIGDWNGDGRPKLGIYRRGLWILDWTGTSAFTATAGRIFSFGGEQGDIPVTGDWTGDGKTKIGIYRAGAWILDTNGDGKFEEGVDTVLHYGGIKGDIPVVGHWTGRGKSNIGVDRKGLWLLDSNGNGQFDGPESRVPDTIVQYGLPEDVPVVGDWTGDGKTKLGVVRDGSTWILDLDGLHMMGKGSPQFTFGSKGSIPIVGPWVPNY